MNRSIQSKIAAAVLAIGALGAGAAANAATSVHFSVGVPVATSAPVYVQPQPVYEAPARVVRVAPPPVYVAQPSYGGEWRYERERSWRAACGAPRWEPLARYMPGDAVRRHGRLYVASELSASVWNVNSPPEWTPNYWVPARCR